MNCCLTASFRFTLSEAISNLLRDSPNAARCARDEADYRTNIRSSLHAAAGLSSARAKRAAIWAPIWDVRSAESSKLDESGATSLKFAAICPP